jgi:hypothetical protein
LRAVILSSARYIFGAWAGIAAVSGLYALVGYSVFSHFSGGRVMPCVRP